MQVSVSTLKKWLVLGLWSGLVATTAAQGLRAPGESPASSLREGGSGAASGALAPAPVPPPPAAPAPALAPAPSVAPGQSAPAAVPQPSAPALGTEGRVVDAIVAIVNNDVITRRELDQRVASARAGLVQQGIQPPPAEVLDRQVLERMVADKAQLQEADRAGIRVSEDQLDMAITRIAEQNNIELSQLREEVQKEGLTWAEYRDELRDQIRMNRLRELEVDRNIIVSEAEIDAFLAEQAAQQTRPGGAPAASGAAMQLAQILVRVPEGSSPSEIATLRRKAEDLLRQARSGTDFGQLAAAASDGEEALRGGDLGFRPTVGWPDLFLQATAELQPGQVAELVQSGNGFHILKVVAREGGSPQQPSLFDAAGPQRVTQSRVRHILIRTSAVISDEQARARLASARDRIVHGGAAFADMARQYSDDASAPQGGEIGWVSPGETVPEFEHAMDGLQPGQVSEPVQTPFGWHLILVEDRRVEDVTDQSRRAQARQVLFQRKLEPAWAEWVSVVRSRAYVDNRLERNLD